MHMGNRCGSLTLTSLQCESSMILLLGGSAETGNEADPSISAHTVPKEMHDLANSHSVSRVSMNHACGVSNFVFTAGVVRCLSRRSRIGQHPDGAAAIHVVTRPSVPNAMYEAACTVFI
jgi:hypothetical protein